MVVAAATPISEIFPSAQSYKALYSINALQTCLKEQLQKVRGPFPWPLDTLNNDFRATTTSASFRTGLEQ